VSFEPRPLTPPGVEPETFSFLGLKGNFDLFLDKTSGIPVRVNGASTSFGEADILLDTAEIKPRGVSSAE
jgi:hypothetical protein